MNPELGSLVGQLTHWLVDPPILVTILTSIETIMFEDKTISYLYRFNFLI